MRRGFSLVELSIVLVIIGLLTGGVLVGQSLIRNANVMSIATDYAIYKHATLAFGEKYKSPPGDMPNATDIWGNSPDCQDSPGADDNGVCNGDGSGAIDNSGSGGNSDSEMFQFWRHLVKAGYLEGNYTGLSGPSNQSHTVPGINTPAAALPSTGWSIYDQGLSAGDNQLFAGFYGNYLMMGVNTNNTGLTTGASLKPKEMFKLDTKIDDGKPATGWVSPRYRGCTTTAVGAAGSTDFDSKYALDADTELCTPLFRQLLNITLIE